MQKMLAEKIRTAVRNLQEEGALPAFDIPEIRVERPQDERFGEFTSNIALVLAKPAVKAPLEIASLIQMKLAADPLEMVERMEVAAPGYLNFALSQEYFRGLVRGILASEPFFTREKKEKVMVEYSQPNTHKEFHIGHLRNVFIGSAIVNVLREAGDEVIAANYIGDTGSHIARCLWGLTTFHAAENLDGLPNKAEFLGQVYAEATQKIEGNPEYEAEFKALQNRLEAGDPELTALWQKTRQWSLDEFERIYRELGVSFDVVFYESIEEVAGKALLPELLEKGVLKESDGAVIADLEAYGLGVLVLVRRDGSALYGLKDIPLAKKKFEEYSIDRSVYVVDIRQALYFKQLFKVLELYGFRKPMQHYGYEFVALKGGESMSSRKGNIIPAETLLKAVEERVRAEFPDSPDPRTIAIGAVKFAMLRHSAASKIEFDIDEAVRLNGATGPYVQYACARIASILRKAAEAGFEEAALAREEESVPFHPKEIELLRELAKFPELLADIAESYEVHKLSHYALRIAERFHSFYNDCQVVDAENPAQSRSRLRTAAATKRVLSETLRLMGIASPEKM